MRNQIHELSIDDLDEVSGGILDPGFSPGGPGPVVPGGLFPGGLFPGGLFPGGPGPVVPGGPVFPLAPGSLKGV
jgi:hypothetical protein